jgi:hypothetical protein
MMTVHKAFVEKVKIDGIILSRPMPEEDLFMSLKKIAKDHGIKRGIIISAIYLFSLYQSTNRLIPSSIFTPG